MIISFADKGTEDIFNGVNSKQARKACPLHLWSVARRKLLMLNVAAELDDLKSPPGNRLEPLTGDRAGQHSIRINNQYRICFIWCLNGATLVEILDSH